MSTYVLMKILESTPARYDLGIRLLTLGRLDKTYDRITACIKAGQKALDIGCGTGALTLRGARKNAWVKGIDINPEMLEIAGKRAAEANLLQNIDLCEIGIAELGNEAPEYYDIVMSGLCFSELSADELTFALQQIKKILKPGGHLLIVDEVSPRSFFKRVIYGLARLPLVIISYLITQTTTKTVKHLPEQIENAGLQIKSLKLSRLENFAEIIAAKSLNKAASLADS